ncbi:MAG: hypothetical protein Q9159_004045 [Coniocarpon cinnabarinum]
MVYVVDLEEESAEPAIHDDPRRSSLDECLQSLNVDPQCNDGLFAAALACYPYAIPLVASIVPALTLRSIVSTIAQNLDLNSLHDLSATCRQFRSNLLLYRNQLVKHTLRCVNDKETMNSRLANRMLQTHNAWRQTRGHAFEGNLTSGRVGLCARDMAPMSAHAHDDLELPSQQLPPSQQSFTHDAFARDPCTCREMVYLCLSCGNALRSADTTYMRCWTWRTRYSTYLGGLGTGIGEGNEGVECGKGRQCLDSKEVEKEIDCDATELANIKREEQAVESPGREYGGTSYLTQEIEGIGGIVKKKVKKRVKVGAVVKEYEDERDHGHYLRREQEGINRSWCHWCERFVLGQKDIQYPGNELAKALTNSDIERKALYIGKYSNLTSTLATEITAIACQDATSSSGNTHVRELPSLPDQEHELIQPTSGAGPTSGGGVARVLAHPQQGNYAVALLARNPDNLSNLSNTLRSQLPQGSIVHPFPTDTDPSNLAQTFQAIQKHPDFANLKLELAIYHVKHASKKSFLTETPQEFGQSLQTYTTGAFAFAQEALKRIYADHGGETLLSDTDGMKKGIIIFTGTLGAMRTNAEFSAYGAGRAAARMVAQGLAKEVSKNGVHVVHTIANGGIRDENSKETREGARMSAESVGKTYLWLAQQEPSLWCHELDLRPAQEKF